MGLRAGRERGFVVWTVTMQKISGTAKDVVEVVQVVVEQGRRTRRR